MALRVKFCGLRAEADVAAAASAGAAYVGFVSFPKSPRHIDLGTLARLAAATPAGLRRVALTVDADDALLGAVAEAGVDMLQLHGDESPERVAQVRERFGLPVMKAVGVAGESDLPAIAEQSRAADMILVDAKPPAGGGIPGGNGLSFDWRLIQGRRWSVPWMLAGGLTPLNVAEAARLTGAGQVDVSSGVERSRGVKDAALIRAFAEAAGAVRAPA